MAGKLVNGRFGQFAESRLLGEGAYGLTYLVHDANGFPFALKLLRNAAPADSAARFENEKWALTHLQHPALPTFMDEGISPDGPYIVMSYAEGETLSRLIDRNKRELVYTSVAKTLLVMERLLDCILYMSSLSLVHRDIKGDNVIISASGDDVTLIDLGLCKGPSVPARDATFWNAGASRFSPPAKLLHPRNENSSHDAFSVGVLAYLLLTSEYPWEVPASGDYRDLANKMTENTPPSIRQINPIVDTRTTEFIHSLLETSDFRRPRIEDALKTAKRLRKGVERAIVPSLKADGGRIKYSHVVRDTLHLDVSITEFERDVLDTPELQRLRRIRQLGLTSLVYPGADHSRFSHVIGSMHLASRILSRIETRTGTLFDAEEHLAARTYALIHDISHAPFGHTIEDELNLFGRHDSNTERLLRIVDGSKSKVGELLQSTSFGRTALEILTRTERVRSYEWIYELTASSIGADVLDYIDRDALYCGLNHRVDDAIYRRYAINTTSLGRSRERHVVSQSYGRHGLRIDADYAAHSILQQRYALFLKVYSHQAKLSAGAMLGKALWLTMEAANLDEARIESMGDDELIRLLAERGNDPAKEIISRLHNRQLYVPAYRAQLLPERERNASAYDRKRAAVREAGFTDPESRLAMEARLAEQADLRPEDVIVYVTPKAPGAQKVRRYVSSDNNAYEVHGESHPVHEAIYKDHLALWNAYVFVARSSDENQLDHIGAEASDLFGLSNQVQMNRRQLALGI